MKRYIFIALLSAGMVIAKDKEKPWITILNKTGEQLRINSGGNPRDDVFIDKASKHEYKWNPWGLVRFFKFKTVDSKRETLFRLYKTSCQLFSWGAIQGSVCMQPKKYEDTNDAPGDKRGFIIEVFKPNEKMLIDGKPVVDDGTNLVAVGHF